MIYLPDVQAIDTPRVVLEVEPDPERTFEFLRQWIENAKARAAARESADKEAA